MSAPAHCGLILRVVAILKTAAKILKQKREEGKENGIRGFPNILSDLRIYFHFGREWREFVSSQRSGQ